jgi:hypothetical protein
MNDSEITRQLSEIARQLTTFEELVKHLATKEETLLLKIDMQKLRVELVLWIIGTNVTIGGILVGVMVYLNNQMMLTMQHWKP